MEKEWEQLHISSIYLWEGHPVLFYSLRTFQESEFIDEIILVTGKDEQEYCRKEIVDQYGFTKVSRIVEGGAERFNSVWNGLQVIKKKGICIYS